MKYRVTHRTHYSYQDPVALCHNLACLRPRNTSIQMCKNHHLDIEPTPIVRSQRQDFFGNWIDYFAVETAHKALKITSVSEIQLTPLDVLPLPNLSPAWEDIRQQLEQDTSNVGLEARRYCLRSPFIEFLPELREYALQSFTPKRPLLAAVCELMGRIFHDFKYDPNSTTIVTPLAEVFAQRNGVCQDFAHLAIASLRCLGLAARYVSGYLETLPPPGQVKLQGVDASHAWFAVYLPEQGWVDFDPTNNQVPAHQHITTAWGRDFGDVTPLKGIVFGGGTHSLAVAVDVDRLKE